MTTAKIIITGDATGLERALNDVNGAVRNATSQIQSEFGRISGVLAGVRSKFLAISAVIGGGSFFKGAVDSAVNMQVEATKLARMLGTTEQRALGLRFALGDLHIETETFNTAIARLTQGMQDGGEKFLKAGVNIKDANGNLKDMSVITAEVNAKILSFKEGADRNAAAAYFYGKGWQEVSRILELTEGHIDAGIEKVRALGIELDAGQIDQYRAALNDAEDTFEALKVRVGSDLLPVLTDLSRWFAEVGPASLNVVGAGFKHLIQFVDETVLAFRLAWNDISHVFTQLVTAAGQMGAAVTALIKRQWEEAKIIWRAGGAELNANSSKHLAEYYRLNREHLDRVNKLWGEHAKTLGATTGRPTGGSARLDIPQSGGGGTARTKRAPAEGAQQDAHIKAQQAAVREAFEYELSTFRALESAAGNNAAARVQIVEAEAAIIRNQYGETSKEFVAAETRVTEAKRAALAQRQEMELSRMALVRDRLLDEVELEEDAARAKMEAGRMSQEQLLVMQEQFEARKFAIRRSYAEQEALQIDPALDPVAHQRAIDQMLAQEDQFKLRQAQIRQRAEEATNRPQENVFASMDRAFEEASESIMMRGENLYTALSGIFKKIFFSYMQEMIIKPVLQAAGRAIKETALFQGLFAKTTASQVTASATTTATKATEATMVVGANAAEGASGAAAAVASTPYVGPVLAAAAFAAIFALIMGAMSSVKSAAGGFDIPAGVNPLTQLHAEEMVLPRAQADVIRNLARGANAGAGAASVNITNHFAMMEPASRRTQEAIAREAGIFIERALTRVN